MVLESQLKFSCFITEYWLIQTDVLNIGRQWGFLISANGSCYGCWTNGQLTGIKIAKCSYCVMSIVIH